ncbi:hypothetical protein GGR51DRAFT_559436 [Nemania sp. FL0031]|nr:hypothetical protein GGR51DRAFT_559436 [Nemania sp. FL0031]
MPEETYSREGSEDNQTIAAFGSTDGTVNESSALELFTVKEDGHVAYLDVGSLEEYLDNTPDKAEALEAVITEICVQIEKEEDFKEWTLDIHDLVARKNYWHGKGHNTLKSWLADHQTFFNSAKQGRAIRNKRKSAINSLVANGVSGPRFEYMIACSSRTFIEAVRKQVDMHGFSYPLVCALANLKAYHRIKSGKRGSKGAHTQTVDIADLDTVMFRELSPAELKLIKAKVGPHGFLVEARAEDRVVIDREFDVATKAFVVGRGGFQQPKEHARTQPRITADDSDGEHQRPNKRARLSKTPDKFDIRKFLYVSECTCPEDVPMALTTGLDKLTPDCGYSAVAGLLPNALESCSKLCSRHCQLVLVRALGRSHLVDKTNREALQAEIRELIPKLEHCFLEDTSLQSKFDSYKKSIGFSWDVVETTSVPQGSYSRQEEQSPTTKQKKP